MTIKNDELNILSKRKHNLIRSYENKEIDDIAYIEQIKVIDEELETKIRIVIKDSIIQEENKMAEEKKVEEQKAAEVPVVENKVVENKEPKAGRKSQDTSYASMIAKALEMKTVKNIDDAVKKVEEFKPGREAPKIKLQIKAIVREVKAGKGRWKAYTWDEENFLLVSKA